MAKSRDAFRTISEVSDWLETPAHVLRFWESRFSQIKPVKRAGGRRYYRPNDMLLLGGIKRLLHDDGITIKGVQKILREKGVKYVGSLSLEPLDGNAAPTSDKSQAETVSKETPIEDILVEDDPVETLTEAAEAPTIPVSDTQPPAISTPIAEVTRAPHDQDDEPARHANIDPAPAAIRSEDDVLSGNLEDRITALYRRLQALRNRVHTDMVDG